MIDTNELLLLNCIYLRMQMGETPAQAFNGIKADMKKVRKMLTKQRLEGAGMEAVDANQIATDESNTVDALALV